MLNDDGKEFLKLNNAEEFPFLKNSQTEQCLRIHILNNPKNKIIFPTR